MHQNELNRRDFNKLTMAALGGMMTGAAVGCGGGGDNAAPPATTTTPPATPEGGGTAVAEVNRAEVHACRGLNECKTDKNECAGLSMCATVSHTCHKENACKYLGGCGETAGSNACKAMGECAVPINDKGSWAKARAAFEARMKTAGKNVGAAPEPAGAKPEAAPTESGNS